MPALIDNIESVRFENGRLRVSASEEFHRRFLNAELFAEYDPRPQSVPHEIAVIPFITSVAPIAFLSGERWTVPLLDRTFASALTVLRSALAREHPDLDFAGEIVPADIIDTPVALGQPSHTHVALFSGGLDSIHAALAHRSGRPFLLTVQGADVVLYDDDQWRHVQRMAREFGEEWGFDNAFVVTNFRTFVDTPRLESRFGVAEWWRELQHGIALIGLTAPIVPVSPGTRVVIASTGGEWFRAPSGSTRAVDETLRWGPVTVEHHGYNLTRPEKAAEVSSWTRSAGHPLPRLRVCFGGYGLEGRNCARCEKCLRTATALLLTGGGADQIREGITDTAMVDRVIRAFRWYRLHIATNHRDHWWALSKVAQNALDTGDLARPEVQRLARWLVGVDFDRYERRRKPLTRLETTAVRTLRRAPAIERLVRAARGKLRRARR